eukprot:1456341-Rhodomonas_salina.1
MQARIAVCIQRYPGTRVSGVHRCNRSSEQFRGQVPKVAVLFVQTGTVKCPGLWIEGRRFVI